MDMAAMNMDNTDAMVNPCRFAWALRDGEVVTKVCEYLVRRDAPARMVVEEGDVARRMAVEWVQAEISHHEQTHSSLTRDVPWCLLRTLYAAHYTEELAPVAHALADATCYLLDQLSEAGQLEELEVVLGSWVFGQHMDHEQQMDALTEAWRSVECNPQVASVLLAHGFDPQRATLRSNVEQIPVLLEHGASATGDTQLIKAVLGAGGSAKSIGELLAIDAEPCDALRQAVQFKELDVITQLASHPRVDLDESSEVFPTPLIQAFRTYFPANNKLGEVTRLQILEILLHQGADANFAWHNEIPLLCACYTRDPAFVQLLLSYGADPNVASRRSSTQPQPHSPLLWFCRADLQAKDVACIQLLLDHGADPNWQYEGGGPTPLHKLCKQTGSLSPQTAQVIKLVVAAGGDLHLPSSQNGQTPLEYLEKSNPQLAQELQHSSVLQQNRMT